MNVSTLKTEGFVSLTYPDELREYVDSAMASWKVFCELPEEIKQTFSGGDRVRDFGYMRRQDDDKEMFRLTLSTLQEIHGRASAVIDDPRATQFVQAIDLLITHIEPTIREFAQEVERTFGLEVGFTNSQGWAFRFLHYFPTEGEVLARPHVDRGGTTFHLYEDAGGGEYLTYDKVWKPWPVDHGRTIIFPGQVLQYQSENQLKGLCHRVVSTPETRQEGRFALVLFVDFPSSHRFDDNKWTQQEFLPGWNYDISFEDFKKYFVPD